MWSLPDGCDDDDYLARARSRARMPPGSGWPMRPFGLAFYLAGADPHEGDRLGRLKLTDAGLLARDQRVLACAARARHSGGGHHGRRLRPRHRAPRSRCRLRTIRAAVASFHAWAARPRRHHSMTTIARLDERTSDRRAAPCSAYRRFTRITTRWMDNDVYGHINNVVYYSFFDTAVNGYLIERGALDIARRRGDRPGGRDALQLLRAAAVPAARRGRRARRRASAARACATRSGMFADAGRDLRRLGSLRPCVRRSCRRAALPPCPTACCRR